MIPTKQGVEAACARVKPYVYNTPILKSSYINELLGAEVFFKCENFQKMGAFKMRGAPNAILNPKKKINVTLSAVKALLKIELN